MSAQVTEAHLELAKTALFSRDKAGRLLTAPMAAQLIADSEGKACAELRAVFPKILAALSNGAGCTPDVSVEFIQSIPNEVAGVVAQLRAEVAWWKNWHDENEKMEDGIAVKVQATIDGLRAEVERLRNQRDNLLKPMREQAIARADSAERELEQAIITRDAACIKLSGELREARAEVERLKSDGAASAFIDMACRASLAEAELATCKESLHLADGTANLALSHRDAAEAELATERARLDWLEKRGFEHRHHETGDHLGYEWTISSYSESEDVTLRDVIDAEMREEAK